MGLRAVCKQLTWQYCFCDEQFHLKDIPVLLNF